MAGLVMSFCAYAQPTTEDFPNFTYTDIDGVEHTLYDYLDNDQIVMIDVFTTWCTNCLNSLPSVESIYDQYGPEGDGTVTLLSFERDVNTTNEAQWVSTNGAHGAVIAEAESEVSDVWNITFQPAFFVICPDRSWELRAGSLNSPDPLVTFIDDCEVNTVSVEEDELDAVKLISPIRNEELEILTDGTSVFQVEVLDLAGKTVLMTEVSSTRNSIDVSTLPAGQYITKVSSDQQTKVLRFVK